MSIRDFSYFISKRYGSAVAFIEVELPDETRSIGAAFHLGSGVFVTARHVVEGNRILEIATTVDGEVLSPRGMVSYGSDPERYSPTYSGKGNLTAGPFYHPDSAVDVAAVIVESIPAPALKLGSHIADEWIADDLYMLRDIVVMGYPPIPFSVRPVLFSSRGEINAVVRKYTGGNVHFIVSAMARGGFSGGPCLDADGTVLGMIVEAFGKNDQPTELGYMAAVSIEPIIECLLHHNILPTEQNIDPEDNWD